MLDRLKCSVSLGVLFAVVASITSACNTLNIDAGDTLTAGQYSGFASNSTSDGSALETPIQGTLALPTPNEETLTFASLPLTGALALQIQLSNKSQNATLTSSPTWLSPVNLTLGPDGCYRVSAPKGQTPPKTAVCIQGTELYVDLVSDNGTELELFLNPVPNTPPGPLEPPTSYTSEELFQQASSQNFDTRIEFERVIASRLTAETAVKNLLPHVAINDVLNVASLNILNIIKAIGDIAPFALPSRWAHAKEAKFQFQSEYYGWVAMRMDAGSMAMGLALSLERDEAILSVLTSEMDALQGVINEVVEKEEDGLVQLGSSDQLRTALATVTQAHDAIYATLDDDRTAIANSAGFLNPAAVTDVVPSPSDQPPAITLTEDQIDQAAISRAPELRQMSDLISAAKLDKTGRYFNFLDPSGDSSGGFGFGWTDYVAIGQAEIDQLQNQQIKLNASILERVHSKLEFLDSNQQTFSDANSDLDIQNRLIDRYTLNLQSGITFSLADMSSAYQEKAKAEVTQITASFGMRTALIELNRLMVSTDYEEVMTSSQALMPTAP